jgi:lysophospholipase L1-like esterase
MRRCRMWGVFLFYAIVLCGVSGVGQGIVNALPDSTNGQYAALGDSVAAGDGLTPSNSNRVNLACGRSSQSYPYILAASLKMHLDHLACSGASLTQGLYGSQQVGNLVLIAQIRQAFKDGTPKLITITIGANDIDWSDVLTQCYTSGCSSVNMQVLQARFVALQHKLSVALATIQIQSKDAHEHTPPRVVLTGYYAVFSNPQPVCSNTGNLTAGDITWINNEEGKLNTILRQSTAPFSFAKYVPLNFAKHELCSADPWIQGLQDAAPFHPNVQGQKAIAQTLLTAIR